MKIIAQLFSTRRCPTCKSSNIITRSFDSETNLIREAIFAQVEKSESERFVCVDCDKWFIDNEGNKPGSGGRSETGTEVIDGSATPTVSDAEKPQNS